MKKRTMRKKVNVSGKKNPFYGKRHTAVWKRAEHWRKRGKKNPMYGRKHSRRTIQKIRQAARRRAAKK